MTEKQFAADRENALPSLRIRASSGDIVLIRGKIDRIDFVHSGPTQLAVVFDYKRTLGKRLKLDEVYHGIALQLLAYLLVLRDAGERSGHPFVVPGGAFYIPLLASHTRVTHPSDADDPEFNAFNGLRPRGIVDFDWIEHIDPAMKDSGKSQAFAVARKKTDGEISNVNISDAVRTGVMLPLLDHVRSRMTELVDQWMEGDIRVNPIRMGNRIPCSTCPFRSVCRFEFSTHRVRTLPPMSRAAVMDALLPRPASGDRTPPEVPYE
ncbi:MAG: PD-(D/E)XK nuclease family protein [Planctomycetes bacterium]|nr:PD-(D/E)XK nuclease family protein [Planctomycetota bacterium]